MNNGLIKQRQKVDSHLFVNEVYYFQVVSKK